MVICLWLFAAAFAMWIEEPVMKVLALWVANLEEGGATIRCIDLAFLFAAAALTALALVTTAMTFMGVIVTLPSLTSVESS